MIFNNNFSKAILLSNHNVKFWNDEYLFYLKIPKVFDFYTNSEFLKLINILETKIEDLNKNFPTYKIKSHFDFFRIVFSLSERQDMFKEISKLLLEGLKIFLPEVFYNNNFLYIKENIILTEELFNKIINIIYTSLGKERIIIYEDDDEFTKIEKQALLRAQEIRKSGRKEQNSKESEKEFENMLAAILYEFPQYTLEKLFDLNIYTLYYLFGYVGRIANYEVSKIAAGNGTIPKGKKHKYFIEK